MTRRLRVTVLWVTLCAAAAVDARAQSPLTYRLSFPQPEHHLMAVDAVFADLPQDPLQLRISRSSPGRYALHDFARNVLELRVTDGNGQPLAVAHPSPWEWTVTSHPSVVHVSYRVFGDRVDGTYLGIDRQHAHVNMPASIVWARGLEHRPIVVRFEPPPGSAWRVATQLLPGVDALTFSASNLQYLMDSPCELSAFATRTFTIADGARTPLFRLAIHHTGSEADVDRVTADLQRIVREERAVFGEFPAFEGNSYTFLADYLPGVVLDGMEHRNSTSLTQPAPIRSDPTESLRGVAHEFFHAWNVERIRPRSLEPFNFDDVNASSELWLAEGFTDYYASLALRRTDVTDLHAFARDMGEAIDAVMSNPAHRLRTPEGMSQLAVFEDEMAWHPPHVSSVSYYQWGEIIALGLDLTLRARSDGRQTLDLFMREMWERFGKPGGREPGYVDRPYTADDVRDVLAMVSSDAAFARDFFARFIQGRDIIDYAPLLARAGLLLTNAAPGRAYAGPAQLVDTPLGPRLTAPVPFDTPLYDAGIDRDDVIAAVGGSAVRTADDFERLIQSHRSGDVVTVTVRRNGHTVSAPVTLVENPHVRVVPVEEMGQTLTAAQRRFRDAWLSSAARNAF